MDTRRTPSRTKRTRTTNRNAEKTSRPNPGRQRRTKNTGRRTRREHRIKWTD